MSERSCSRDTMLLDSEVDPRRTTSRLSGLPVLAPLRSIPAAMACIRMYTLTTSATPRIVARVDRQRTSTLRTLYFSGRAMEREEGVGGREWRVGRGEREPGMQVDADLLIFDFDCLCSVQGLEAVDDAGACDGKRGRNR